MICEVTVSLVKRLTYLLREADLLCHGDNIECFLYKAYGCNTVENLSLVILGDFIYKARFTPEKYAFQNVYHKQHKWGRGYV